MRRPLHIRLFAPIALAAILLLALVPTTGRLVTSGAPLLAAATLASAASGAQVAKAASHHAAHAAVAAHSSSEPSPPGGHEGHDCAYCPLLASAVSLQVPTINLPAIKAAVLVASLTLHEHRAVARTPGLGSRGPPRFVQG